MLWRQPKADTSDASGTLAVGVPAPGLAAGWGGDAEGRDRTDTNVTSPDFESGASTNSATSAPVGDISHGAEEVNHDSLIRWPRAALHAKIRAMRRFAVIGVGNMGEALVRGIVRAGLVPAASVIACDTRAEVAERLSGELGIGHAPLSEALADADVVILAVKPQGMAAVLAAANDAGVRAGVVVLSVAAGVSIATLEAGLPAGVEVVRTMPNTPALVGLGASAFALGTTRSGRGEAVAKAVLGSVGIALEVPEAAMDAVTALSGSGPAYVFRMLEALTDAGVAAGLEPAVATALARQTLLGAATLADANEGAVAPAELRRRVTSPGGTTEAALKVLEARGWGAILGEAVLAAKARGEALGRIARDETTPGQPNRGALARVTEVVARAGHPVVVLDLDLTLVENAPRTRAVLRSWLAEITSERRAEAIAHAASMPLVFSIRDNLTTLIDVLAVPDRDAHLASGIAHWKRGFFDPAYLVHDEAMPGAAEAVAKLAKAGATIVYLTARPGTLAAATTQHLFELGFPAADAGAVLVTKTDPNEGDHAFKVRALAWCARLGEVVLCAENEPAHANAMHHAFPDALTVLVTTRHSLPAPALEAGVVKVAALTDAL